MQAQQAIPQAIADQLNLSALQGLSWPIAPEPIALQFDEAMRDNLSAAGPMPSSAEIAAAWAFSVSSVLAHASREGLTLSPEDLEILADILSNLGEHLCGDRPLPERLFFTPDEKRIAHH